MYTPMHGCCVDLYDECHSFPQTMDYNVITIYSSSDNKCEP